MVWLIANTLELMLLATFGQRHTNASEKLGDMYYMCNWEQLLVTESSQDYRDIMNMLEFSIFRCQKPVYISALNFFALSKENIMNVSMTRIC